MITEQEHVTTIRSRRSQKEWVAIIVPLITGAGVAFFTIMMYFQTFYHQWIFWIFAFLFLLLAVVKLTEGFSKLLQPAVDHIVIDQQQRTLAALLPDGEKLVVHFDEIRELLLQETANDKKASEQVLTPTGYVIAFNNRDGLEHVILQIHSAQGSLFNIPANAGGAAHALVKIIAEKTGKLFEDRTVSALDLTAIMR